MASVAHWRHPGHVVSLVDTRVVQAQLAGEAGLEMTVEELHYFGGRYLHKDYSQT